MVLVPSVHLIGPEGVGGLLGDGQDLKEGGGLNLAAVPHKSNCCVASNDNNNKKKKKKERKKERERKKNREISLVPKEQTVKENDTGRRRRPA